MAARRQRAQAERGAAISTGGRMVTGSSEVPGGHILDTSVDGFWPGDRCRLSTQICVVP